MIMIPNVKNIHYGTSNVKKVFQGDVLVWPNEANNVIFYTSSNGNIVTPKRSDGFGANIVSNVYVQGTGIITFDGPVTSIGTQAFENCRTLTSVVIPESVTLIYPYAFANTSISSMTIPESVVAIGSSAFEYCANLTSINIPSAVTMISGGLFQYCSSLTSITIPSSITTIGNFAFYDSGLTSITIPSSVTTIQNAVFGYCEHLTSVSLPNTISYIDSQTFECCSSLSSITIPNSVTIIGGNAFHLCTSLTTITIPSSIQTIWYGAFADCTSLTNITVLPTTPPTYRPWSGTGFAQPDMFDDTNNAPIYVPAGTDSTYKTADGWKLYKTRIRTS